VSAPEGVDDARRGANAPARADGALLVTDEERELALEHVERINVLPVDVRVRAGPSAVELRFRDAELLEGRLDQNPATEQRLALAGSVNDPCHCPRV
jgi:hypothetical protein